MGQTSGERSQSLQFLGLAQLLFKLAALLVAALVLGKLMLCACQRAAQLGRRSCGALAERSIAFLGCAAECSRGRG